MRRCRVSRVSFALSHASVWARPPVASAEASSFLRRPCMFPLGIGDPPAPGVAPQPRGPVVELVEVLLGGGERLVEVVRRRDVLLRHLLESSFIVRAESEDLSTWDLAVTRGGGG